MLKLKTEELELRGIKDEVSKKTNNVYYVVFCEDMAGEPFKFLCRDPKAFPNGLDKGDRIFVTLNCNRYNNLEIDRIEKIK